MFSVLMVGSFPPPISGQGVANSEVLELVKRRCKVRHVNTCFVSEPVLPGTITFAKVLRLATFYPSLIRVFSSDLIYITPGLSRGAFLKIVPFIFLAVFLKKRVVVHFHGAMFPKTFLSFPLWQRNIIRKLLSQCKSIIVLSQSLYEDYIRSLQLDNIEIVSNFFKEQDIPESKFKPQFTDGVVFLYLSNLIPEKGVYESMEAVQRLRMKGFNVRLEICGGISEIEEKRFRLCLEQYKNFCTYHGLIDTEKPAMFGKSHFFILPTYYPLEGVPLSLLEAMASGLVPVVTTAGGIRDVVSSEDAVLVEKRSVESIVSSMLPILSCEDAYKEMSKKCVDVAYKNYTVERFHGEIERIFFQKSQKSCVEEGRSLNCGS